MKDSLVVVDTSVWIDYFRGEKTRVIEQVDLLLDKDAIVMPKVVLAELFQGAKEKKEINTLKDYFSPLHHLGESESTWEKAGQLSFDLKKRGHTIHLTDCYIATIAREHDCRVFTFDKHFKVMEQQGSVRLFSFSL